MLNIMCFVIYLLLRALKLTYRFEYQGGDALEQKRPNSYILAMWHQNILSAILAHTDKHFSMIISPSKDGEYVSKVCRLFGHEPIRGSSSKGGVKALINSIRSLKSGTPSAVAIDGPRGPLYSIKPGVFEMAKKAQVPLIPMTIVPKSFWTFDKAWDKFRLPRPFTKIVIHYGTPIFIDSSINKEELGDYVDKLNQSLLSTEEKIVSSFA